MAFAHVLAFCRAMVAEIADYVQMPTADEEKEIAQHWEAECRDAGIGGGGGAVEATCPTTLKLWWRRPRLWTVKVIHFYFCLFLHVNLGLYQKIVDQSRGVFSFG